MTIESLLYNGREMPLKVPVEDVSVIPYPQYSAAPVFQSNKVTCPDCKKKLFALFKEKYRYVCWCVTETCRTKQAVASRAKARGETVKEKETGAEKFHVGRVFHNAVLAKWISSAGDQKRVLEWMTNKKTFLVVLGSPGTGKSYLAAAVLNYIHEKGEEIAYVTHRRFIDDLHSGMQHGKTQHEIISRHSDKKYLIIDDLGGTAGSEWQQEMVLELIDRRYSNNQKTMITSNFTQDQLRIKFGEKTAYRLLEGENEVLEFWSTDRRNEPSKPTEKHWTDVDE